ncbi:uncharacterized protein LOC130989593 [Salvia miltiorrhiza]|uniref:uncharacterized protein LOC130989593 n=1 Tax=Salvia miltiorrhiza TaxID=226208 RepID=UPI0025ABF946|nr:uncharacterized protein LOC130989593 [Salvia miltiorrhiza]
MTELAAPPSFRPALIPGGLSRFYSVRPTLKCQYTVAKQLRLLKIQAQITNPSTYSSRISTDVPLSEIPGASFDDYLEDKPRVFKAIFPDKRRSHQINEEEWRVQMLPIEFLFLTVSPVVDMRLRCKSSGIGYPPGVPCDISKVIDLEIVRCELQGLDDMIKPSQFSLSVKGVLYPDRRGPRSRLKGQLQMSISFDLPPMLSLVPEDIRRDVAESVLKRLVGNMKDKVNDNLTADYSQFKRERPKAFA